jgi:hypothetical protein
VFGHPGVGLDLGLHGIDEVVCVNEDIELFIDIYTMLIKS